MNMVKVEVGNSPLICHYSEC